MILHLGVIEQPYTDDPSVTTGDVAEILEANYGVMGAFVEMHEQDIADALTDSMQGALENLMAGASQSANPFGTAESAIVDQFKGFLEREEMNGRPGVPTKAALDGVNHRLKIEKGSPRPSFIDTSLYEDSMVAWIET